MDIGIRSVSACESQRSWSRDDRNSSNIGKQNERPQVKNAYFYKMFVSVAPNRELVSAESARHLFLTCRVHGAAYLLGARIDDSVAVEGIRGGELLHN